MAEIRCDKCGAVMMDDSHSGVKACKCWYCGNRHYPAFPKGISTMEICQNCGDGFKRETQTAGIEITVKTQ